MITSRAHRAAPGPRRGGRLVAVSTAAVVVLAGCGGGDDPTAGATSAPTSTSTATTSATSAPETTSSADPSSAAATTYPVPVGPDGPGPQGVTVTLPPAGVPATGPVVVLVHGGAWVSGSPDLLADWADALAATGAVVFNASYRLVGDADPPGAGYPGSIDDVACAVRYARAEAPAYTDSDQLMIMGHSAGGHLGAVVALDPDGYGGDCPYPAAAPADRFVGLAGIYDVVEIGPLFGGFVGASRADAPESWAAVNPVDLAGRRTDLDVVLVTGGDDRVVPPLQARSLADLLPAERVAVVEIAGADHLELQDPAVVGVETVLEGP